MCLAGMPSAYGISRNQSGSGFQPLSWSFYIFEQFRLGSKQHSRMEPGTARLRSMLE